MMQMRAFNSLHNEFYNKQIYDMLDELQVSGVILSVWTLCMCYVIGAGSGWSSAFSYCIHIWKEEIFE